MLCKDRAGNIVGAITSQDKLINYLYNTTAGRFSSNFVVMPCVSKLGGILLNSKISTVFIDDFVEKNNIDMTEYEEAKYSSYNDFFIRKIKAGKREINRADDVFISPCDSKLSVYEIDDNSAFMIKDVPYTFYSLTRSKYLSEKFSGGYLMIYRLSVDDYHRYSYVDSGVKSKNYRIKGVFHTVNPVATEVYPVYRENERELSLLHSDNFGDIMMMEVGATMVGKIVNYHQMRRVKKGMEKGRFEFGGSTVILAIEKGVVHIDADIIENSNAGYETKVRLGERVGIRA